ncbi:MAG: Bacillopeptidase F [Verrucomicrobia subdivision 3 bacterium]|nr:Bacillopeptidase F [Limisphaerales bacterium]
MREAFRWVANRAASLTRRAVLLLGASVAFEAGTLPAKLGDIDEDGVATIHDVVAILNHVHGRVTLAEARLSFADLDRNGVVNVTDADLVADAVVAGLSLADIDFSPVLLPTIPYTNQDRFTFGGAVFPRTRVRVSHAFGAVEADSDGQGAFAIEIPLNSDRLQFYYVSSFDASGTQTMPLPLSILRDTQGPAIRVISPPNGWVTSQSEVVVSGTVGDALNGQRGMSVSVNGVAAAVTVGTGRNGSFLSAPVSLELGANMIQIRSVDVVGNETVVDLIVTRQTAGAFRLVKQSGDRQKGVSGGQLGEPVSVLVQGPGGVPIAGKAVVFQVMGGLGEISPIGGVYGPAVSRLIAISDPSGEAQVNWRLGANAGKGNHLLKASSRDMEGELYFVASALPSAVVRLNHAGGNAQVAGVGTMATESLRVWVNDGANALSGQDVTFNVLTGGGKVNGHPFFSVSSDAAGFAEVQYLLGAQAGEQTISASVPNQAEASVVFTLTGVAAAADGDTSVSGLVLTPFLQAVPHTRVELMVEGTRFGPVNSDMAGSFRLTGVMPGAAELQFWLPVGSTSQATPSAPISVKSLYLIRGVDNQLSDPILLPLTLNRLVTSFDGASSVDLVLRGVEGFSLTIPAGSVAANDGTLPTAAAPFSLSLTQIPMPNLPMPPALGEAPRVAWLLEPADVRFLSPPRLKFPDLAGVSGDTTVGVFGFDSRLHRFGRLATTGASGSPAEFQSEGDVSPIQAGFGFVNAGYQGRRATVASGGGTSAPIE